MKRAYSPKKQERRNSSVFKFVENPKKKQIKAKSERSKAWKNNIAELIYEVA